MTAPAGGVRVLLVDDQPARLLTYESILNGLPVSCVRALSGLEALEQLMKQEFALILLDVCMPGMDGFETARLVRNHPRFEKTPIIFVTGIHVTELDQLKGYEVGAIDYISVPIVPEILRSKVAVLVELYQRRTELEQLNRALEEAREKLSREHTAAIAASEARMRAIFEHPAQLTVMLEAQRDSSGNITDWRYVDANTQASIWLGIARDELVGKSLLQVFPDRAERVSRLCVDVLASQKPMQYEVPYGELDFLITLFPLGDHTVISSGIDITARNKAERSLRESESRLTSLVQEREHLLEAERAARSEAEIAMRAKDEFLATLSHELRTPLSNVVSWARVLQRKFSDENEQMKKGLDIIVDNAMAQSQLISDLLDMSRIVAGKVTLETRPVDIVELVARAVNAQRPVAEQKDLELELLQEMEVGFVLGDPTRLQQVVWNLLSNAIKFTPAGGAAIRICTRHLPAHYEIEVSDAGEGIAPEFLPHIFGRFRQADASAARRHGGLGLGLAIVSQLVEMHGGSVRVASEGRNRGACFTVRLPKYEAEVRRPFSPGNIDADPIAADALRGYRIMAIEDQPAMLEYLKRMLGEHGADVLPCASAQEALDTLAAQGKDCADIVISDLGLPNVDGYQFIRKLRGELALSETDLPAIALTAFARDADRARSLAQGFQAHLTKPYQVNQLIDLIIRLVPRS